MEEKNYIRVRRDRRDIFVIPIEIYIRLFDHTIVRRKSAYLKSLKDKRILYSHFIDLTRQAEIPYPYFLASKDFVDEAIRKFETTVFFGVSQSTIAMACRGDISLSDISLILKDLTRKQSIMADTIDSVNEYPNRYRRSNLNVVDKAEDIRNTLGIDLSEISVLSKEKTYYYLVEKLSEKNIFVSLYVHNYSPQTISKDLNFAGICIRHNKCPIIFVRAGNSDAVIEPWGRRIFTIALLLACLVEGKVGAIAVDNTAKDLINNDLYLFAEEILMPNSRLSQWHMNDFDDIEQTAELFSVSPSAMVMRLFRLGSITPEDKDKYLSILSDRFNEHKSKKTGMRKIGTEKAITLYNNPSVVRTIIQLVDNKKITIRDAKNILYYQKGSEFNLTQLREYIG